MVGSPYQTAENLAEDLIYMKKLRPQMIGVGPFIPHKDTPFRDFPPGTLEDTLFLLSLIRIMHPWVLLPATTALGTIQPDGREQGILAGANVVMPNISPEAVSYTHLHRAIHAVAHLVEDHAERAGVPSRFAATKLVESDKPMLELLQLSENEVDMIEHSVKEMEYELDTDREAALADMRYTFIENLCADTVVRCGESKEHIRSCLLYTSRCV